MTPRIYVIGFNSQERIDRAFASIPNKYSRVLLDNGPDSLTAPDGVEHVKTGPAYFTSAFNHALYDAMDRGAVPIICNDDVELEPDCIPELMKSIEAGSGLAVAMQVDMAVPDSVIMGGTEKAYPSGIHRLGRRAGFTKPTDHPWLPFCVTAVNPELIREIGVLDRSLQMWYSDSDYSIRCRMTGRACMLVPSAVVRHEQSASVNAERRDPDSKLHKIMMLDQLAFFRKYGGGILEEYS